MPKNQKPEQKPAKKDIPAVYKITALIIIAAVAVYFIFVYTGNKATNPDEEYMFKKNGELNNFFRFRAG